MQKFSEMCIATYRDNIHQAKLANQHTSVIWVGYAEHYSTGTYRFSTPTKKIILTRDVTYLQKTYGKYAKVEKSILVTMSNEGSNDEEKLEMVPVIKK